LHDKHSEPERHVGWVLVRASGRFDLVTAVGQVQRIGARWCQVAARSEGYAYA
jgi:hypothetical protein